MAVHVDKSGKKVGYLTVIEYLGKSQWLCRCDCGADTTVTTKYLNRGKNQSCGCKKTIHYEDFTGARFGRLVAIEHVSPNSWKCQCDCGNTKVIRACSLKNGNTKSCGCIGGHTTHGGKNERLYAVWCDIKQRCFNENNPSYERYGGRGITVCEEWLDYAVFREWALTAGYDKNAARNVSTIDRIDNDGNYCPENCRIVNQSVQSKNRRPYKNPKRCIPVDEIDEFGNVIHSYESVQQASEATGCRASSICSVCRGTYKTSLGHRWRYATNKFLLKAKE